MSRLVIPTNSEAQNVVEGLYKDLERRIIASPPGLCPVDLTAAFLKMCHAQTCGKCVPCRIGLAQLSNLLEDILNGKGTMKHLTMLEETARVIESTADCAIGYTAAQMVLKGLDGFKEDFMEHILHNRCRSNLDQPVPCVALCPAGVDIPGYIALTGEGRYADAVRLIRKDNPFPTACALVCEHPCESRCRRNMLDNSINIRGIKRVAVDMAGYVPAPACPTSTGKRIAIIGGGPSGLSAAYYLQLMGHQTTVFEKRKKLGGMLLYGIPSYRLPRARLQDDINVILETGVEVRLETSVGNEPGQLSLEELRKEYDAIYIAIGAHQDKKTGIPGEDSRNVISAVEMLKAIGDDVMPDFTGKQVVVIGGGNVAMDVTRSSIRLGASKVTCVYRRRIEDMTALAEEIEEAIGEGCQILPLQAPSRIEADEEGKVTALWTQPQHIGPYGNDGRPKPVAADAPEFRIPCDYVIVAIGQSIVSQPFEAIGVATHRGTILADLRPDELLSGSMLAENGIREPLYVTALRYAGVDITPDKHPAHVDSLVLDDTDTQKLRDWFTARPRPAAQPEREPLLEVKGLSFGYQKGQQTLRDVSFSIGKGEMVSIVGRNGAGKSTLSKLICGFETPDAGEIFLNGKPLAEENIRRRAQHIGYVMQNPNQMISKTMIYDEVALGLQRSGLTEEQIREKVEATLRVCGLYPFRNWPISALSFGQKKRVTIASVLVLDPELILLDEPTAGQDFRHYTDIMEFLRGLNARGVTVVMITHDMHLMLEYTRRALVFCDGRLIADRTAAAVLCDPALVEQAALKETSLYTLANRCGIAPAQEFVERFIEQDREVREGGR